MSGHMVEVHKLYHWATDYNNWVYGRGEERSLGATIATLCEQHIYMQWLLWQQKSSIRELRSADRIKHTLENTETKLDKMLSEFNNISDQVAIIDNKWKETTIIHFFDIQLVGHL